MVALLQNTIVYVKCAGPGIFSAFIVSQNHRVLTILVWPSIIPRLHYGFIIYIFWSQPLTTSSLFHILLLPVGRCFPLQNSSSRILFWSGRKRYWSLASPEKLTFLLLYQIWFEGLALWNGGLLGGLNPILELVHVGSMPSRHFWLENKELDLVEWEQCCSWWPFFF